MEDLMSEIGEEVEWERLGSALGVADSELEKIKESSGKDKDECKKELFKVVIMRGLYMTDCLCTVVLHPY